MHNVNWGVLLPFFREVDVHMFKDRFVKNQGNKFDIFKDTANNSILWLGNKSQKIWVETGYFPEDLFEIFPEGR